MFHALFVKDGIAESNRSEALNLFKNYRPAPPITAPIPAIAITIKNMIIPIMIIIIIGTRYLSSIMISSGFTIDPGKS
jgi:hypothetical protein